MRHSTNICSLLVLGLALSAAPTFGQRGRPSGPPAGAGPGTSHDNNSGPHGSSGNADTANAGPKTADQLLTQNTKLSANLQKLLPASTSPQQACANFKNLGQCVAAIHVAHNLSIDFNSLACDMTLQPVAPATSCPATTGSSKMSLGKSIQALSPNADPKGEARKANKQAQTDLKGTTSS